MFSGNVLLSDYVTKLLLQNFITPTRDVAMIESTTVVLVLQIQMLTGFSQSRLVLQKNEGIFQHCSPL